MEHRIVEIVAVIALAGMLAQWLAWRFRIPAIVILTAAGLLLGPVFGLVKPSADFGELLRPFVQLAVAVILFEGGLNLRLHELGEAGAGVRRLISLGLLFNFVLGSLAAHYIGGLSWPVSLVFGAIIVVTGPTVIMPLLRQARLNQRAASLLKWEAIVNDPVGALLTVVIFKYFVLSDAGNSGVVLIGTLVGTLIAAALMGGVLGYLVGVAYRSGVVPEFLKGPGLLVAVIAVFAGANTIHDEAGLVAATVLGVVIGNMRLPSLDEMRRFKEYITVMLVSALFIVLTADLDPAILRAVDWRSVALLAAVIFLVRPVAVTLATINAGMAREDRLLAGWIAPRGIVAAAVAGAFAAPMVSAGYPDAAKLLPLIFGLILATVILHGFSIGWYSRYLGIASKSDNGVIIIGASPWAIDLVSVMESLKIPVLLVDSSWHRLRPARLGGLPIYFGQVVSESADENLDMGAMGYLIAATDNDAYNALVCTRFANELGRTRVFQLPMPPPDEHDTKGLMIGLRGNPAFSESALYEELLRRYFQGWRFQKTRLTEAYDFETYFEDTPESGFAMLVVRPNGQIVIGNEPATPAAGDVVVNFLPPRDTSKKRGSG